MPKRTDLQTILILGSGPIQIGQAAEFDYSGTQALKALKNEGYRVILVNSNPATIMTDPELADATYLEPLTPEFVEKIIEKEKPDAILPTLGGQTALNLAMELHERGSLEKYGVELIGAGVEAIKKGEDRELFQAAMKKIGVETARGKMVHSMEEAVEYQKEIGLPIVIRPSFTLGGTGGGIAHTYEEFLAITEGGLRDSPVTSVLLEESILGWKEYELEVMRDTADTVIIITSIENFDPMGVHTGDSITVAPAQTLSDVEYQRLRDQSLAIIREIGVATGGSNIQFAVNPDNGRVIVIEMNPRVSRSSALASKATGFPIAKIAALLAVGYHLDELPNDITRVTPASFEPSIDYVVTKIPRFAFEKFPGTPDGLGTQMRSVGEVMAIGRTFKESLQKALRSTEGDIRGVYAEMDEAGLRALLYPNPRRIEAVIELLRRGESVESLFDATKIDRWFLSQLKEIMDAEKEILDLGPIAEWKYELWREVKRLGFSDARIGEIVGLSELEVRDLRKKAKATPVYKTVDTCAAEFEAHTPYHYSTYEWEDEVAPTDKPKVVILGSGPNRIGQGVEFDYATVHAVWALQEAGYETIMVNSNPETVSTDYDTADRLYFEPLTFEDVMNIVEHEKPVGVIVQLGGQTPLKLAKKLADAGAPIIGTSPETIHEAEDRASFNALCERLGLPQPRGKVAQTPAQARELAAELGFPLMARPSYVLGGRAMRTVRSMDELTTYLDEVYAAVEGQPSILLDQFLEGALELDVDTLCDGERAVVAGIMEHVEAAGVHSGDSACILPPVTLDAGVLERVKADTERLALELGVRGLMNVQWAVKDGTAYILEANPRASRTVPFVSKAVNHPLAKSAARIAAGQTLEQIGLLETPTPRMYSVKEVHLPFLKFKDVLPVLGPEMKSTGESMGIDSDPYLAFYRAQLGAKNYLPLEGTALLIGDGLDEVAGTLEGAGLKVIREQDGDELPDLLIDVTGSPLLRTALERGVPIVSTKEGAEWTARAVAEAKKAGMLGVRSLQEWVK
ncbi:carbamoyl-phosphate synthase large subunit [Deinococcus radiodurans]|mgnify:CR=1 FL=1|jgi:carbamoyl-phosphate synthase large subunit|uniref:Carbamoyl phosphate synthase large chain n=1 Tax=Deinococcus radiodurans (strain ATCC 13939 / DSM 20539 / JCM 16871 / CCUG 27074 / LMG 4051 / NBRC 15346 / NCIMB 9279 / VKM B-1422 / R1) TaxID=243230 RepID=CARB_DEIRA|nr:carbamoyl-phosphate synthase large subunit [Deinococcus radiodurans]Q9RWK0.1 RecName: Full=Carbamoyl phosphate synthase large chain; AltName: Full=Carbamoyl phosphate synthetase ammonia chain [Deinococcus radiodurans R1 = ATCC 13939 = DSM 20539]AAF10248.1 carbamoyl-phosphate synthase, large subunit [Deinococcus radiodurans R1 = ATCC 13939 = DSM 20539]ANC72104.1 carbamoyl phosphate synthase large subunit [Deinococcus radiodurans R1 = ATCC 13939 = DSM 20539]QEM72610.1 carbamoyl-phosphate synth